MAQQQALAEIASRIRALIKQPVIDKPLGIEILEWILALSVDEANWLVGLAESAAKDPVLVERFRTGCFKEERWGVLLLSRSVKLKLSNQATSYEQLAKEVVAALDYVVRVFPPTPGAEGSVFKFDSRELDLKSDGTMTMLRGMCVNAVTDHSHEWRRILESQSSSTRDLAEELLAKFLTTDLWPLGLTSSKRRPRRPTPDFAISRPTPPPQNPRSARRAMAPNHSHGDGRRYLAPFLADRLSRYMHRQRFPRPPRTQVASKPQLHIHLTAALDTIASHENPHSALDLAEVASTCLSMGRQEDIPLLLSSICCDVSLTHLSVVTGRKYNSLVVLLRRARARIVNRAKTRIADRYSEKLGLAASEDAIHWLERLLKPQGARRKAYLDASHGQPARVHRIFDHLSELSVRAMNDISVQGHIGFGSPTRGQDGVVGTVTLLTGNIAPPLDGDHNLLASIGPPRSPLVVMARLVFEEYGRVSARFSQPLPIRPDIGLYSPEQVRFYITPCGSPDRAAEW